MRLHPPADDIRGRLMGAQIGLDAFELARLYYGNPTRGPNPRSPDPRGRRGG